MSIWSEGGGCFAQYAKTIWVIYCQTATIRNKFTRTRMINDASQALDKTDNADKLIVERTHNYADSKRLV
jgi:hypothetical protein